MPELTVIIVNYNTRESLRKTLKAVGWEHEVIVVDNASADDSGQMVEMEFPYVKLIQNKKNVGFGRANNQAIDIATGDFVLFLNSDCRPRADAIRRLIEAMGEGPDAIAVGGRLVFPNGKTQKSCANQLTMWAVFCEQTGLEKIFPWTRTFCPYWETDRLMQQPGNLHEVEQVMGACLMMKNVLKFDEKFFLYVEDTELCHRLREVGSIYYVKDAVFEHELGASSSKSRWEAIGRYNYGKTLYFEKFYGSKAAGTCRFLNWMGGFGRLMAYLFLNLITIFLVPKFRESLGLWFKVLRSGKSGPPLPRDSR